MAVSRAPAHDSARQRMVWLFPLVFCLGTGSDVPQSSSNPRLMNGILGESIVLPLELPAGKIASVIVWSHKEALQGTIMFIIQLKEPEKPNIINANREKEKRLNITQSYSLQLNNLTMADTGSYTAQITSASLEASRRAGAHTGWQAVPETESPGKKEVAKTSYTRSEPTCRNLLGSHKR